MATLVLTAVGTALGGPVGGAIGALIGRSVDGAVLGGGKREGARLSDLKVQTSSYGSDIPLLFGTMRVAGTVIWSTDLIETRSTSSAGKGQPSVNSYSYAASFAVLLSARAIVDVRRIWADGNLLRGAAGDFKAATGFRLHRGGEDQEVDPLIASAVGAGLAPAHRGCAYAVFEHLQLSDFGNRIPSLTFEVVADGEPVSAGAIARGVAPEVRGDVGFAMQGFAAADASVRGVLDTLGSASGAWFAPAGDVLLMRDVGDVDAVVSDDGARAGGTAARRTRQVAAIETVPRMIAVTYYDPARDYQAGLQRARRPGAGVREDTVAMPAVIDGGTAKALAGAMLARAEAARTTRTVACGIAALAIAPGQCVGIEGEQGVWHVNEVLVEGMVVRLTLMPLAGGMNPATADSGRVLAAADAAIGRTRLAVFELPALDDAVLASPRVSIAACGEGAGWRRAALLLSLDGGASWSSAGATALPAVMGTLVSVAAAAPATLADRRGSIVVALERADMMLEDADDARLDAGANLALAGEELVQFGRAEPLGGGRWRLSGLLRGRRGTEAAAGRQVPGDRFVLIGDDSIRAIDVPPSSLGSEVRVMATGLGDAEAPVEARVTVSGASVLPPSPAQLGWTVGPDGGATVRWCRRSRSGWRWIDGVDAPLAEEQEAYRITVQRGDGSVTGDTTATNWPLEPETLAAGPLTVSVRQRGTWGDSPAATITIATGRA